MAWHKLRVEIACFQLLIRIDGTDIALENSPALKGTFGCSGPKKDAATAFGSPAYGPLDHAIYDCQLAPLRHR